MGERGSDDGSTGMPLDRRFRLAGIATLVVGVAAAGAVWLSAGEGDGSAKIAADLSRAAAREFQLERIGGKFAVTADRLSTWFDGLWAGRPLALTLLVLSVVVAAGCFGLAAIARDEVRPARGRRRAG